MNAKTPICALIVFVATTVAFAADDQHALMARLDQSAAQFQAMSASVHYTTHVAVIDDNSEESGTVTMKKTGTNQIAGRIDFTKPDPRTVIFEQRKAQVYYPKIKTLQIYDLGKHGEQLDRFLMIGFGSSGTELARDYEMKILGTETLAGKPATRLELVPKTQEIRNVVSKLELWIPDNSPPYPLQEKIYEKTPGDYRIVNYTNLKINPPVSEDVLKLKLPSGVKTEYPQK